MLKEKNLYSLACIDKISKKKRLIKDMNEVTCYVANWGRIHQAEKTESAKALRGKYS